MTLMHEWILVSILFEWEADRITLLLFDADEAGMVSIVADTVFDLRVPQANDWGPSIYVNEAKGPSNIAQGRQRLEIEMQSGDVIVVEAAAFNIPPAVSASL